MRPGAQRLMWPEARMPSAQLHLGTNPNPHLTEEKTTEMSRSDKRPDAYRWGTTTDPGP